MKSGLKVSLKRQIFLDVRVATYAAMKSGLKESYQDTSHPVSAVATYAAMKSGLKGFLRWDSMCRAFSSNLCRDEKRTER